jgi:hypothetical protein
VWDFSLQAIRQSLMDQLPEEPACDCTQPISTLRIRCPGGDNLVRRFLAQHSLQILLNFVASKGFPSSEYKLLTTFPRKDVSYAKLWLSAILNIALFQLAQEDPTRTLQDLRLCPQETLILEEK